MEQTQMLALSHKDVKTVIIIVFHMFRKRKDQTHLETQIM